MQVGIRCCGTGHRGKAGGEAIDGVGGAGHIGADRFLCDGGGGGEPFSESTGFSCYADGVSLRGCARSLLQNVLPQARVCLSNFASALAVPCKCADSRHLPPNFTESTQRMRKLGPKPRSESSRLSKQLKGSRALHAIPGAPKKPHTNINAAVSTRKELNSTARSKPPSSSLSPTAYPCSDLISEPAAAFAFGHSRRCMRRTAGPDQAHLLSAKPELLDEDLLQRPELRKVLRPAPRSHARAG